MVDPITRYCREAGITPTELARRINRSPQLLNDFKSLRCRLGDRTKLDIVAVTQGRVTLEDLTVWGARKPGRGRGGRVE